MAFRKVQQGNWALMDKLSDCTALELQSTALEQLIKNVASQVQNHLQAGTTNAQTAWRQKKGQMPIRVPQWKGGGVTILVPHTKKEIQAIRGGSS